MATTILGKDPNNSRREVEVTAEGQIITHSNWSPLQVADTTTNDSDKTLTVPAGKEWHVMSIHVSYTSSATAGNRQLEIRFLDNDDDIMSSARARLTQAASLSYQYEFAPGLTNDTAAYDTDHITTSIPSTLVLPAGYKVRIFDNNAIAPAGDTMTVHMMILERSA